MVGFLQRWNRVSLPNKLNIVLTFVICLATVANVLIFTRQVADQDKQVEGITNAITVGISQAKETAESTLNQNKQALEAVLKENRETTAASLKTTSEQSRRAMESSAAQSKAALDASIGNARLDQRAWVGAVGVNTEGGIAERDSFAIKSVQLILRNSGKTPALKVGGRCCIIMTRLWRDPIPDYDTAVKEDEEMKRRSRQKMSEDLTRKDPEMAAQIADRFKEMDALEASAMKRYLHEGGILAPEVPQALSIVQSTQWGTRITENNFGPGLGLPATIYILGKITYNDIFPGTPQRSTKFCLMRTTGTVFAFCPEGNWMD